MKMETVYTLQEVMEILKVSMSVATAELTSGRLKSFRVGRQWRVAESNLLAYIHGEVGTVKPVVEVMDEVPPKVEEEKIPIDAEAEFIVEVVDHVEAVPQVDKPAFPEDVNKTITLMKEAGKSLVAIADYLNSVGSTNKGRAWNKDSVNKVYKNAN